MIQRETADASPSRSQSTAEIASKKPLSVGSTVRSLRVGVIPEFVGEIVSIVENPESRFAVVVDAQGRSWHRSFHEIKALGVEP